MKKYGKLYLNIFISEGTRKKHFSFFTSEKSPVLLFVIATYCFIHYDYTLLLYIRMREQLIRYYVTGRVSLLAI